MILLAIVLLAGVPQSGRAQVLVEGRVVDAETGAAISQASIVQQGTTRGTITNREGRFTLRVERLPVTIEIRHVSYQTERVTVEVGADRDVRVSLQPAVVELDEVVVAGDDFADNIMRKVIAQKRQWRETLHTYRADGYTKLRLERTGDVVLLSETVYDVVWDRTRGPREVVRSVRRTDDFHEALPVHPAGHVPNFYADRIDLQGVSMIGPTHPEALKYYHFTLARQRRWNGRVVYDLYVSPKTALHGTFIGQVSVLDEAYAMIYADLRPARHVRFPPPLDAWRGAYYQQFRSVGNGAWMPIDLEAEGSFRVSEDARTARSATMHKVVRFSDYRFNTPVPDSLYARNQRVIVDSQAVLDDYLFFRGRDIVPLTPREEEALATLRYQKLDLDEALPVEEKTSFLTRFLTPFKDDGEPRFAWPDILGWRLRFRYNRVDGWLSGIGQIVRPIPHLELEGRLAQAAGLNRIRYYARGRYEYAGAFVEGRFSLDTQPWPGPSLYPVALTSIPARLGGADYFNYFWSRTMALRGGYARPRWGLRLRVAQEEHESVERDVQSPWPFTHTFRPNPAIEEGQLRSVRLSLRLGERIDPDATTAQHHLTLRVEHSPGTGVGSDFAFTQLDGRAAFRSTTFFRQRPVPNTLSVFLRGSTAWGTLPVQRFAGLDASLARFSPYGSFRTLRHRLYAGEHAFGVFWNHDFKTVPFEGVGLTPFVHREMGLAVHGGHGRTWMEEERASSFEGTARLPDRWHHEVGLSLTNVGGLPLRLDLTYRIDDPGWYVGVGLARPLLWWR